MHRDLKAGTTPAGRTVTDGAAAAF
jgi:hypothetical protein